MISSPVPAATAVVSGMVTTVPLWELVTLTVVVASCVRVPPGKAAPLFAYKRTVTGCVWLADSTPKDTEFTK